MKESGYKSYEDLAAVPERGNSGKGAGGVSLIRLRADARRRKVHSAPPGIYAGYTLCSLAPPLPMKTHCVFMGASYGFPVLKIGSRMVVPKEQFICWVEEHTGGGT